MGAVSGLGLVRSFCARCSGEAHQQAGRLCGHPVGGIVDLVWAQLSGGIFDLYEIVPGFVCGLIAIFVVSLLTAAPSKEITDEFDSYRSCEE
ncbi:MAG: hypothetical protein ACLR4Z_09265 [Butyricicoccaceae bacterium]